MLAVTTAERPRHDARRGEDIPGARRQPPEQAARPAPVSQVTFHLPPHLLAALVPLLVLLVALDVYCLVDLTRARSMGGAAKLTWAVVVVFVSAPLGALLYLFLGRDRARGRPGRPAGRHGPPPRRRPSPRPPPGAGRPPADGDDHRTDQGLRRHRPVRRRPRGARRLGLRPGRPRRRRPDDAAVPAGGGQGGGPPRR